MPKVTEEHKEARREQILVGAQRAFAQHGYEGATVARLEEETGLSRGAIFNYFENKEALFVSLVRRSSDRLSVQVEAARRVRTDQRFREQIERHLEETKDRRESRLERLRGLARDDVPIEVIAHFLGTLANGFAFSRVTDDPMPDLGQLMTLIETGVAPR